ncbi:MAG: septum formation inhibitor Maf [Sulfurospirillaceae bacterium]|nr:septum formation inhibitor Maf [Sulfurospirillaceae bacterium]
MIKLVLASKSPTRAKLLKEFSIDFIQRGADFDEDSIETKIPKDFVYFATKGKLAAYLSQNDLKYPVLCADTVVCSNGEILRKAKDKDHAREILLKQSGNEVSIITCLIYKSVNLEFIDISQTRYLFSSFDKDMLDAYLESDEWKDKAGACMVEGFCKKYIKDVKGLQSTAMGLSVERLIPILKLEP